LGVGTANFPIFTLRLRRTYYFGGTRRSHNTLQDGLNVPLVSTRSSATAEEPRDALCQLKSCQLLYSSTKKITFQKVCSRRSLKLIGNASIRLVLYHFLLVVCSNNDAIWHRFRNITTFTMYVTVCDLKKSFIFEKTV